MPATTVAPPRGSTVRTVRESRNTRGLIVSHDSEMVPGLVGDELSSRGVHLDTFVVLDDATQPVSDRPFPDASPYDVVVVMGSPWSVFDPAISGWIDRELAWLRTVHDRDQPLLGICFGAQALAAALGGTVERATQSEVGWFCVDPVGVDPVRAGEADEADEADDTLIERGPWMQWHHDRFTVPPGARLLASSPAGPQAFLLGRTLAVQFHPEVDPATLDLWLGDVEVRDPTLERLGLTVAELRATTARHHDDARRRVRRLVDHLLSPIA
jgi:GMP synthase-like glutamine amidotransferase